MVRQRQDVGPAFAKRRHANHRTRNAMVEIAAEAPGAHLQLEIAIRGADQPELGPPPLIAAHPLVGSLLNQAQQLGLQGVREFADLVQEQRAAVGQGERAVAAAHGAGVGSPLVAEELAARQLRHQGGAVDDDELFFVLPAVQGMDEPRRQFFAGAAFAFEQA